MDTGIYYQDRDIVVKRERYYKDKRYAVLNIWDEGIPLGPQLLQTYGGNDYENALHFARGFSMAKSVFVGHKRKAENV